MNVEQAIMELVMQLSPYEEVDEQTLLLENGVLDSLKLMVLVGLIEEMFEIEIIQDELTPENFENVQSICTFLEKRYEARGIQ